MVIFLDIDGVICTTLSTRLSEWLRLPPERQVFDPLALYWLRKLVRRTGAEIVLCSSWRDALAVDDPLCRAFIGNLYGCLSRNGTPIMDAAPQLDSGDKGEEILAWLADHPCERYAVLDDHDCFALGPAVRAHWVPVPENRGLRRREALAAEKLLTACCAVPDGNDADERKFIGSQAGLAKKSCIKNKSAVKWTHGKHNQQR